MNNRQVATLVIALSFGILMGAFPPWVSTANVRLGEYSESWERPVGYAFLVAPPDTARNAMGDPQYQRIGMGVRLDAARLGVQYIILALFTGALFVCLRKNVSLRPLTSAPSPAVAAIDAPVSGRLANAVRVHSPSAMYRQGFHPLNDLNAWLTVLAGAAINTFFVPNARSSTSPETLAGHFIGAAIVCLLGGCVSGVIAWRCIRRSHNAGMIGFAIGVAAILVLAYAGQMRMSTLR